MREGGYEEAISDNDQVYAFVRTDPTERLLVAVNLGPDQAELTIGPHHILWSGDTPVVRTTTTSDVVLTGFGLSIAQMIAPATD